MFLSVARCVPHPDVLCPASQFFNVARLWRAELQERRARRCVPASVVRCIPPGPRLRERALSVWDLPYRLRGLPVPAAVQVALQRAVPDSAMFREV